MLDIFEIESQDYLPRLALNRDPPDFASWVTQIISVNHHCLACPASFGDGVLWTIFLCCPQHTILLISASHVAKIIGVSHWCPESMYILKIIFFFCRVLVSHACSPSYSGGRDQEDCGLKPAWANSLWETVSKIPNITKRGGGDGWWSGLRCSPEFKPQYCKKKIIIIIFLFIYLVWVIGPRVSCMLNMYFIAELQPQLPHLNKKWSF
jgi:hypothetical protein